MWHEARKQERLIRGMIVDYRRRAERRRDFYEKIVNINADSTQILQLHGRQCKIHLEPAVAAAGDSASIMMPWQGDHSNIIDRFDVRAHLDYIPEIRVPDTPPENLSQEERNCNYERYRILAQNLFLSISEEKFLHQLAIEERYGVTVEEKEHHKEKSNEKKSHGASIGYNYDNPSQTFSTSKNSTKEDKDNDSEEESDNDIMDVDLSIDVNKVDSTQAHAMNTCGTNFGMLDTDLFSFLTGDAHEAERHRQQMREEKEKALFSGRKSRRQRRAHRDKMLATRTVSPPHYAARPSPTKNLNQDSPSSNRSISPDVNNTVTYITSFGGEDDHPSESTRNTFSKASYADKVKLGIESKTYASVLRDSGKKTSKRYSSPKRRSSPFSKSRRSTSRSCTSRSQKSRSRSWSRPRRDSKSFRPKRSSYRSRSRHRSRSYSRNRNRSYSRSTSRSAKSHSRDRWSSKSSQSSSSSRTTSSSSSSRSRKGNSNKPNSHNRTPERINLNYSNSANAANTSNPPRYYGRKRDGDKSSSSELSIDSSDDQSNTTEMSSKTTVGGKNSQVSNTLRSNSGSASKPSGGEKISLKERLRRKMQAQLSRQLRADKKAEAERLEREHQMQQERDDEMREMAIKMRRRQREMRHQRRNSYSSNDRDSSSSSMEHSPKHSRRRSHEKDEKRKFDSTPPPRRQRDINNDNKEPSYDNSRKQTSSRISPEKDYRSSSKGSKYKDDKRRHDKKDSSSSYHHMKRSSDSESDISKPPTRRLVDY